MRKSREETARTRERILEIASALFRKNGIAATSLADLMGAAGLTHGGFYRHFESKDQVVAECAARAMKDLLTLLEGLPDPETRVAAYLGEHHRLHPESGCPLAALGSEATRADKATRDNLSAGVERLLLLLTGPRGRGPAVAAVATLVGALTLSRLVTDERLSREILAQSELACLSLANGSHR